MKPVMKEPFAGLWQNRQPFDEVQKLSLSASREDIFRDKEGRRTLRFQINEQSFFLKYHRGVGWREIFKNLVQLRAPVLGARNEYEAATALKAAGIDTLTPLAYGSRGCNPATQESFLITTDLADTTSLEDVCRQWRGAPPAFHLKRALVNKVAAITKAMHAAGINHRDFYLCHFLLENGAEAKIKNSEDFYCYLIDLHRCQIRKRVPLRWLEKDLGGLLYSSLDIGLTRRDCFRFLKVYTGKPLRETLRDPLWQRTWANARNLYEKDFDKPAPPLFRLSS